MNNPEDIPPIAIPSDESPPPPPTEARHTFTPIELFPLPPAILGFGAIVLVAFLFALVRIPHSFGAGIEFERAQKSIASGNNKAAISSLKTVVNEFPNSDGAKLSLALAYAKDHQYEESANILAQYEGKRVSKEQDQQLTEIESYLPSTGAPNSDGGSEK